MTAITYTIIFHKKENRILVQFEQNAQWNKRIKAIAGTRWSNTLNGWTIPDTPENRKKCRLAQATPAMTKKEITALPVIKSNQIAPTGIETGKTVLSHISDANKEALKKFLQQLTLKAYSPSTIRTYGNEFGAFLQTLGNHAAEKLTVQRIKDYLQYCHTELKLSENSIHSRMNALKFYYEQVLKREKFFWEIPRPKKPLELPKVLNKEEIVAIIKAINNIKHKTMIMLAYG
jgi:integrase/recombinase XerD